jgi:hypothetical protein
MDRASADGFFNINDLAEESGGYPCRTAFFTLHCARLSALRSATHPRPGRTRDRSRLARRRASHHSARCCRSAAASRQIGMASLVRMRSRARRSELPRRGGKLGRKEGPSFARKGAGGRRRFLCAFTPLLGSRDSLLRDPTHGVGRTTDRSPPARRRWSRRRSREDRAAAASRRCGYLRWFGCAHARGVRNYRGVARPICQTFLIGNRGERTWHASTTRWCS